MVFRHRRHPSARPALALMLCAVLALPAASLAEPLGLQECIDLAMRQNLQYLSDYQSLARSQAQLAAARAPFGLQAVADVSLPSYAESRDLQESVALQRRTFEESTDFRYNGDVTFTQRFRHMGSLSVVTSAQRRDFTSSVREDVLDVVGDLSVRYSQDLLHTPREEVSLRQSELTLSNARYNYDRQRLLLEGDVVDAYYGLVQSIRQLEIEQQRLAQSVASLDLAQRKFEIGLIAEVEALRLEVAKLNAEASYARAETQIERSRDQLRLVLGMRMDEPLEVIGEVQARRWAIDPSLALEVGLRQRTDMREAEIAEQIRDLSLQDIRRRNGVTATLNASVSLLGRGDELGDVSRNLARNNWGVGIQVNVPLLDNGTRQSEIRQAEIQLEQSRLSRELRRQQIVQSVRDAVRNVSEAERQIDLRQAAQRVAERTYQVEQSRFELGLAQSQDLLDAQAELTQRRIDALDAVISYQRQLKNLRLATMADLSVISTAPPE